MSRDLLIYVAGPITKGDITANVAAAHNTGVTLIKAGFSVIVPHGSCFFGNVLQADDVHQNPEGFVPSPSVEGIHYEDWMAMDFVLIGRCDALLRIRGDSDGADREVKHALAINIPVFHTVGQVIEWASRREREEAA